MWFILQFSVMRANISFFIRNLDQAIVLTVYLFNIKICAFYKFLTKLIDLYLLCNTTIFYFLDFMFINNNSIIINFLFTVGKLITDSSYSLEEWANKNQLIYTYFIQQTIIFIINSIIYNCILPHPMFWFFCKRKEPFRCSLSHQVCCSRVYYP